MTAGPNPLDRAATPSGDPIMTAKFLVPAVKAPVVPRPRLFDHLTNGVRGPLTLVSAPAGSGKTVLVSSWVRNGDPLPGPVVWISLEEEDQLPGVFWSYVLAGLRRAGLETGRVRPPDRPDAVEHSLLVRLAAMLCERTAPVVLVLDNAEALSRQQVFDDLDFLLRHTAGQLRLVLVTRVDPNMALPQYRLEGAVTEVRFTELAFTPDEARPLLAGRRPELSDAAVAAFSHRTRGWAAGLRLVSVDDADVEVEDRADFAGTDIAVYFRHEVLDVQTARVRDLLLATSVVDVLDPDLAVVLSGSRAAAPALRELAQASVFLDPVPGAAEAYAYHPLVRDLLRAQLRLESPSRMRRLHRKAARWLVEAGRTTEAIEQFAAADDWEAAAELLVVARAVGPMLIGARPGVGEVFARMPVGTPGPAAAVAAATSALLQGDLDGAGKHLRRAEELVGTDPAVADGLPMALAVTETARAAFGAEADGALTGAAAVQDLLAQAATASAPAAAAVALFAAARARFVRGELAIARDLFTAALEDEQSASSGPAGSSGAVRAGDAWRRYLRAQLALVEAQDGRLDAAARAAAAALDGASSGSHQPDHQPEHLTLVAAHVALAWVSTDRGDLHPATEHVQAAWADHDGWADPLCAAALALVRSRLMRLRGDLAGTLRVLAHWRDRRAARTPAWLARRMDAAEARALVADGRPDAAESLVRGAATQDAPECLLAHGWVKLATGAAAESWRTARQVSRLGALPVELLVEANLLGAAGALALARPDAAAAGVDEAVRLASPEGLRRPFEEVPARLRALLAQREQHRRAEVPRRADASRAADTAARAELPGPAQPPARPRPAAPTPTGSGSSGPAGSSVSAPRRSDAPGQHAGAAPAGGTDSGVIIQPLTERELEVLTYLDQLLPTEEIAARMFVSVNTVKTHVRAVLRKLAAERRNDAVRRARELGLV